MRTELRLRPVIRDLLRRASLLSEIPFRMLRSLAFAWLRGHVIYIDLGWFKFTHHGTLVRSVFLGRPIIRLPLDGVNPGTGQPAEVDPGEVYRGIALLEITLYNLCIEHDCSAAAMKERPDLRRAATYTFAQARDLIDKAYRILEFYRPRTVIFPQGFILPAAVFRSVARRLGIRTVAIENTFRSDRLCWDDQTGITLNSPIPAAIFAKTQARNSGDYFQGYLDTARKLKSAEHSVRNAKRPKAFDGRKILFIGQVNTDSSVLFYLGAGFRDQMSAIATAVKFVAGSEGCNLIIKVHPKEIGGLNPLMEPYSLERYRVLRQSCTVAGCDRILIDDTADLDTFAAIEWADLCVTINSQAGLEAAAMGKPVIVCGHANYSSLTSVRHAPTPEALLLALEDPSPPVDAAEARDFFQVYCETYCKPKTVRSLVELSRGQSIPRRGP